MSTSPPPPSASPASAQRQIGQAASAAVDHLADTLPVLDRAAALWKAGIAPVAGDAAPRSVRDALNGAWLGHPIHPILVTVPLGAWTLTTVMDLLGERRTADRCLAAGVLAASAAAITGSAQWNGVTDHQRPRRIGVVHAILNTAATSIYAGSWVLRARGHRGAGVATAAVGLGVVSLSGWLGGHLAYTLGVGVESDAFVRQATDGQPTGDDAGEGSRLDGSLDSHFGPA